MAGISASVPVGCVIAYVPTVVGAFILSVISAVALPLFRASLEKSHAQIKRVIPGRATDATRTTRPRSAANTTSTVRATSGKVASAPLPLERPRPSLAAGRHGPRKSPRARKAWVAVGGTAIVFLIGVGSILGFQAATGYAFSNGTGDLQSGVSQVVSNTSGSNVTPTMKPKPNAPAVEPSAVPTDPATDLSERPTSTPTPTLTDRPTPSAKQTAPAGAGTAAPSSTPHPAVTPTGAVPTK